MIGDDISILDLGPKFTVKDGIFHAEHLSFKQDENNFGKVLYTGMKNKPNFIGQIDSETGREDTFGDMADRTARCALWLRSQGVKPGDVIGICTHVHIDAAIPLLASLCTGAVINPWWDHGLTRETAKHFMTLTKPKIVFTDEAYTKMIGEVASECKVNFKIIVFDKKSNYETFENAIGKFTHADAEGFQCAQLSSMNEPAFIEYTSGSTGLPKGALHPHKSLFGNIMNVNTFSGHNHVVLCYSNLCWITGVLCTLSCISSYNTRIIAKAFTPENLCQIVEKYKVTTIITGTSAANRLLKSGEMSKYNFSSLKNMWVGGAPLQEETQNDLRAALPGVDIIQLYGTTETGGISLHQWRDSKPRSVGTVARYFDMKIIDPESGKVLGANEEGEICVRSPFLMTGYYQNPEKTKEIIKPGGWLHTGDLAYYDETGTVFIIDRLKELIKWRGHHASPSVIEQLIMTYPGVTEAGVVGVPDWEDDERPIAFITKRPDAKVDPEEIRKLVEKELPEQMWLRGGIHILDQMPHTASGKIGRSELKVMAKKFMRKS